MRPAPSGPTRMLSGLMSRWTMPSACAAPMPRAAPANTRMISAVVRMRVLHHARADSPSSTLPSRRSRCHAMSPRRTRARHWGARASRGPAPRARVALQSRASSRIGARQLEREVANRGSGHSRERPRPSRPARRRAARRSVRIAFAGRRPRGHRRTPFGDARVALHDAQHLAACLARLDVSRQRAIVRALCQGRELLGAGTRHGGRILPASPAISSKKRWCTRQESNPQSRGHYMAAECDAVAHPPHGRRGDASPRVSCDSDGG